MSSSVRLARAILLVGSIVVAPRVARAYTCTPVFDSNPLITQAWNQRCMPYFINDDASLLAGGDRRLLVAQSFEVWSKVDCTDLEIVDAGYTNAGPGFDPKSNDNQNVVMAIDDAAYAAEVFASNELLAITLTSYSVDTGEIFDADIVLNDSAFDFDDIADEAACRQGRVAIYDLRNTLVHEMGHFFGFDHVEDEEATMFRSAQACETKKRTLGADDTDAVCSVYATGQAVDTCSPPAGGYDQENVSRYRDQCTNVVGGGGSACSCRSTSSPSSAELGLFGALAIAAFFVRRRRR